MRVLIAGHHCGRLGGIPDSTESLITGSSEDGRSEFASVASTRPGPDGRHPMCPNFLPWSLPDAKLRVHAGKTIKAATVSSEGRHASAGAVSVAWSSDVGPRDENQDRAVAHVGSDGSWMVAVADGMGGPPRGREAAIGAIRGLPRRISTPEELNDGFAAANDQVARLTPAHLRFTMSDFHLCPAATLCAAAWTPEGGLLVGYAGDTVPGCCGTTTATGTDARWGLRIVAPTARSRSLWEHREYGRKLTTAATAAWTSSPRTTSDARRQIRNRHCQRRSVGTDHQAQISRRRVARRPSRSDTRLRAQPRRPRSPRHRHPDHDGSLHSRTRRQCHGRRCLCRRASSMKTLADEALTELADRLGQRGIRYRVCLWAREQNTVDLHNGNRAGYPEPFTDSNGNGDDGESSTDLNVDGTWTAALGGYPTGLCCQRGS